MSCYFYGVVMNVLLKRDHLSRTQRKEGSEWCVCLEEEHSIKDLMRECAQCDRGTVGRPGELEQRGSEWQIKSAAYQVGPWRPL